MKKLFKVSAVLLVVTLFNTEDLLGSQSTVQQIPTAATVTPTAATVITAVNSGDKEMLRPYKPGLVQRVWDSIKSSFSKSKQDFMDEFFHERRFGNDFDFERKRLKKQFSGHSRLKKNDDYQQRLTRLNENIKARVVAAKKGDKGEVNRLEGEAESIINPDIARVVGDKQQQQINEAQQTAATLQKELEEAKDKHAKQMQKQAKDAENAQERALQKQADAHKAALQQQADDHAKALETVQNEFDRAVTVDPSALDRLKTLFPGSKLLAGSSALTKSGRQDMILKIAAERGLKLEDIQERYPDIKAGVDAAKAKKEEAKQKEAERKRQEQEEKDRILREAVEKRKAAQQAAEQVEAAKQAAEQAAEAAEDAEQAAERTTGPSVRKRVADGFRSLASGILGK